jgi:hypothetical protein
MTRHEINWDLIQNIVLFILHDFYLKAFSDVVNLLQWIQKNRKKNGSEAWHFSCS